MMIDFEREILSAGLLERTETTLAGGEHANNHLNIDRLDEFHDLFERVTTAMAHLILENSCEAPQFLAPIPSGGDIFAETISQKLAVEGKKVPVFKFQKAPGGLFTPIGGYSREKQLDQFDSGIVVDDVSTTFSSLARFLKTPVLSRKQNLTFLAVWHRGFPESEIELDIKKLWLVKKPIPTQLPDNSPLWRHVTSQGV